MSTIYERIKERRLELGLTVEDLAKKMGYKDKSSISKIENGKADIPQSKVMAFARALETTTAYLMGVDEEKERPTLPAGAIPVRPGPMIPVLGEVRCGLPMYAEENVRGYVSYQGNSGERYYALRATGDKLNQNAVQYASEGKWGLYCNVQYALYRITVQEGKYKEAFKCLAITVFYTLNNGDIYPMPPGLIDDIRKLSIKLNTTDELMIDDLKRLYKGMYAPSRNFSNDEVTLIFTAYAFGYDEMAENTINRKLES